LCRAGGWQDLAPFAQRKALIHGLHGIGEPWPWSIRPSG